MSELKWNWAYYPYLDTPEKQAESALKAGYIKVVNKDDADKVIAEKDAEITGLRDECAELHNRIATLLSQLRIRDERIDELKSEVLRLEVENENRNGQT